jgi:hypothetical protein
VEIGAIVHGPAIRARLAAELATPRGNYLPLRIERDVVGWVDQERADLLTRFADVFDRRTSGLTSGLVLNTTLTTSVARTAALDRLVDVLAAEGRLSAWRDEHYAIATHLSAAMPDRTRCRALDALRYPPLELSGPGADHGSG